jgi:hypothetical protein
MNDDPASLGKGVSGARAIFDTRNQQVDTYIVHQRFPQKLEARIKAHCGASVPDLHRRLLVA